jgi:hypothetical protein
LDKQEKTMARKLRDKEIDSREARGKLKPRPKPYYKGIERGLHLGYRRLKGKSGTWIARHYVGEQQYDVERIGIADDTNDADGLVVLDFWQAQAKARQRMVERAKAAAGIAGPLTVADVMDAYLAHLDDHAKSASDARGRIYAHVIPVLAAHQRAPTAADRCQRGNDTPS